MTAGLAAARRTYLPTGEAVTWSLGDDSAPRYPMTLKRAGARCVVTVEDEDRRAVHVYDVVTSTELVSATPDATQARWARVEGPGAAPPEAHVEPNQEQVPFLATRAQRHEFFRRLAVERDVVVSDAEVDRAVAAGTYSHADLDHIRAKLGIAQTVEMELFVADVDNDGTAELILLHGNHETTPFSVYRRRDDGLSMVELPAALTSALGRSAPMFEPSPRGTLIAFHEPSTNVRRRLRWERERIVSCDSPSCYPSCGADRDCPHSECRAGHCTPIASVQCPARHSLCGQSRSAPQLG